MKQSSITAFFRYPLLLVFIFFLAPAGQAIIKLPRGFQDEVVAYGLRQPVAVEFASDGRLFIVEKQGRVRILKDGKLLKKPFLRVKVNPLYERGLLGFALDPDFANNQFVYIYRTTGGSRPVNTVERYTAKGDVASSRSRKVLLTGIRSDAGIHNAGCLRFGPDGKLYISTGDGGQNSELAQDLGSLNGKILRINGDGTIPPDNPFVNQPGARGEIWCYGLRNPWRFAFDPETGLMVIGDVGADAFEEINVGKAGANYGWPFAEGPSGDSRFTDPIYVYDHEDGGAAVTVGTFYRSEKFPKKFRGRLFFTDYARAFVKTLRLDPSGSLRFIRSFATGLNTPVDMAQGPDGSLVYVSISGGEVHRIRYVGGSNRPPIAKASASPRAGAAPLSVRFSSNGSYDPDRNPISYEWELGDGITSDEPNPTHLYSRKGTYYAILKVTDSKGATGFSRTLRISVGNRPPTAQITKPANGTVVRLGQVVQFEGKATDPEDGNIPPENLFWSAKLHHNDHTHPVFGRATGNSGSFPIPNTLHATGELFFRLQLKAIDSGGLTHFQSVDLPLDTE